MGEGECGFQAVGGSIVPPSFSSEDDDDCHLMMLKNCHSSVPGPNIQTPLPSQDSILHHSEKHVHSSCLALPTSLDTPHHLPPSLFLSLRPANRTDCLTLLRRVWPQRISWCYNNHRGVMIVIPSLTLILNLLSLTPVTSYTCHSREARTRAMESGLW